MKRNKDTRRERAGLKETKQEHKRETSKVRRNRRHGKKKESEKE